MSCEIWRILYLYVCAYASVQIGRFVDNRKHESTHPYIHAHTYMHIY